MAKEQKIENYKIKDAKSCVLSVDFGTSRTKAAIWDSVSEQVRIFMIGEDEKNYIPSLFHLDKSSTITFGEEAHDLQIYDPLGALEYVKLQLDQMLRAANGEKIEAGHLLTQLFKYLFYLFEDKIKSLGKITSKQLVLSLPARWQFEDIYLEAVKNTGYSFDHISFIKEPVAAAYHWKRQEKPHFQGSLIVIDIGGGTVDWACLQIKEEDIHIVPESYPKGVTGAGLEIDKSLLRLLVEKVQTLDEIERDRLLDYIQQHKMLLLNYIRKSKERYSAKKGEDIIFNVCGTRIAIKRMTVQQAMLGVETQRIIQKSCNYILSAYQIVQQPLTCILVGGGSKIAGFADFFRSKLIQLSEEKGIEINLEIPSQSHYTTALGAIYYFLQKNRWDISTKTRIEEKNNNNNYSVKFKADSSPIKSHFDPDKI